MVENVVSASANPFELRHLTPADPAFLTTELKKEFPDSRRKQRNPLLYARKRTCICPEMYVQDFYNTRALQGEDCPIAKDISRDCLCCSRGRTRQQRARDPT